MVTRVTSSTWADCTRSWTSADKADKEYDKAMKQMRADQGSIRQVANAFIQANETDRALEAYERGSKMLPEGQSFALRDRRICTVPKAIRPRW